MGTVTKTDVFGTPFATLIVHSLGSRLLLVACCSQEVSGRPFRLLNAVVCDLIRELQEALSAGTIALEISSRNSASRRSKSVGIACAPAWA